MERNVNQNEFMKHEKVLGKRRKQVNQVWAKDKPSNVKCVQTKHQSVVKKQISRQTIDWRMSS